MKIKFILLLFSFLLCPLQNYAQVQPSAETEKHFPSPMGYVSDFEHILTNDQILALNLVLKNYENETTNQIAIVTTTSIAPYTNFAKYSFDLASEWKVGQKDKDNGLVIVISTNLREMRIATGRGTEKILTDSICQEIINTVMIPEFKKGDYYIGIRNGIETIMEKWK